MISSVAASGVQSSLARFNASVANAGAGDTVKAVTDVAAAKNDVQANIAVLRTTYDLEKSTFERFA